ncbi:MAG: SDR family NAD(P)-dependent oxidoreductase [Geodermatophilaceae bacterium]|nr:SDR family NAD(P)-dependent oxidoreductase [Geodermatophilaceae bacterium]MDQ3466297.1 SDR family NAD(P)-dependent oxidoreductase [Actinomycetota bacterium]
MGVLLSDKVVIVTGAGRGLGRGEALELARQGAVVVLNEYDAETGQTVVDEITAGGGRALLVAGDVSEVEVGDRLVDTAISEFGQLDALVNNAGILRDRTLANMTPEEWDAVIKVHLRGHYTTTHAACRYWKDAKRPGRIVHTASTSGILGNFGQANYGAAKAGIAAFSTIVAQEMMKYDVTSNAIAPAARTAMTESAYGEIAQGDGDFDFWHPDNVAPFVAFLCSDAAAHISGKVFGVQGDTVEIYQPFTSVAVIENGGKRWEPAQFTERVGELFEASGIVPQAEYMMTKLRYTMSNRG